MRIGVSSRLFGGYSLSEGVRLAQEQGYAGVELWYEDLLPVDDSVRSELANVAVEYYVHAASRDVNFLSVNPRIARVSLEELLRSLELAAELSANAVVVHPGHMSSSKDAPAIYWERLVCALKSLVARATELNVRLVVENMEVRSKEIVVYPADVVALLRSFDEQELSICLDLAHANTTGSVEGFLEPKLWNRVSHIHLSNSADGRTHLPLAQGHAVVTSTLWHTLRTFSGPVVVEGYDHRQDPLSVLAENKAKLQEWGLWER